MTSTQAVTHWLEHAGQRLGLCPAIGGSVAAWQWWRDGRPLDLWRPWDGRSPEPGQMACFPLVPWSNRIQGGFEHAGVFHAMRPNTGDDPYPIHGDGWQQAWTLEQHGVDTATLHLTSCRHEGNPQHYTARQTFQLHPSGLMHDLRVCNRGPDALPFGLGLHPWFVRTPQCHVRASVDAVWLAGPDKLPTSCSTAFPPGWDLNQGVQVDHAVIDNAYAGWRGDAVLCWPEHDLSLSVRATLNTPNDALAPLDLVLYTPAASDIFCFEPVSHPINAPHLPHRPGWHVLRPGEQMHLRVEWRFGTGSTSRVNTRGSTGARCS